MKGASRGVCVLRKESPASGVLTKTCGADAINYRRI